MITGILLYPRFFPATSTMTSQEGKSTGLDAHQGDAAIERIEHRDAPEQGRLDSKEASMEAAAKGQGVSGYETLGLWETIKSFKVCTLVCFMVAFSAATDGYQIG